MQVSRTWESYSAQQVLQKALTRDRTPYAAVMCALSVLLCLDIRPRRLHMTACLFKKKLHTSSSQLTADQAPDTPLGDRLIHKLDRCIGVKYFKQCKAWKRPC